MVAKLLDPFSRPEHIGGYFACPEVAGSAECDLQGCVWPLSCPARPAGRQRRVAGRRGTEATRSPRVGSSALLIPRGPAPPEPTYSVARKSLAVPYANPPSTPLKAV